MDMWPYKVNYIRTSILSLCLLAAAGQGMQRDSSLYVPLNIEGAPLKTEGSFFHGLQPAAAREFPAPSCTSVSTASPGSSSLWTLDIIAANAAALNMRISLLSQAAAVYGPVTSSRLMQLDISPPEWRAREVSSHGGRTDNQPLKMRCQSCALVTSSGHLLGSKLGNKIDQTECVIRMNDAPTRGYGQDVGNKTSLRVIAHSSIQRILRSRNELLNMSQGTVFVFWGPSSYMRRDGKGLVFNNLQLINKILPRLKVHTITRHKMLQFDELFKKETGKDRKISNTWLSTGWFTMSIALELCNTINVYGMVPPDFCRSPNHTTVPYHYYEPMGPDECTMYISHERGRKGSHHRFITEKKVFANWARTFNINFFQPDWKPEAHTGKHLLVKPMF
ncbi:PREDICTED: alpha-N-acetylgalactosaminide alpha-2,6-sialyltransferase 5 [Nanorana parkeri]|uniref:alpha-N-acetylgalactosaminide alpha-2,6-sialyltransferase 5 n=1 Tax=Nanorana parkeri TaxID=125878 RepID=UPI00085415D0|nr:PREDICTED: alpha-N-acetylgalactosaminide alpha-2,6-sialyltransferase 5 [Nanorana parkeri]